MIRIEHLGFLTKLTGANTMSNTKRLLRLPQVLKATGLKKSTFYKLVSQNQFSKGVNISARCKAWDSQEIDNWIKSKLEQAA